MLTADELVELALGRVGEVTTNYPSARGPMYRRVGVRQRQIFVRAAQINPEYFGQSVTATLSAGTFNLASLSASPELLQRVEILAPGASSYVAGREVAIVGLNDSSGELAPRVTVRSQTLAQVGTDLAGVTSLKLYYSTFPAAIATNAGTTSLSLDTPWDGLLEVDLAQWVIQKATAVPADARSAAIAALKAEEDQLLADFDAHLCAVTPTISRFVAPLTRPGMTPPAPAARAKKGPA
jgi:hypothetical protein